MHEQYPEKISKSLKGNICEPATQILGTTNQCSKKWVSGKIIELTNKTKKVATQRYINVFEKPPTQSWQIATLTRVQLLRIENEQCQLVTATGSINF